MAMFMNYKLMEKSNCFFLFNIVTIVLLIWIHHPYYNKVLYLYYRKCIVCFYYYNRVLEGRYNPDITIDINFRRSLARHDFQKNLDNSSLREKLPNYRNHRGKKKQDDISSYGHLNRAGLNDLDNYMKGYNNRYSKKKGMAKLDCYCEKKIFDKIDYINKIAEKLENNKKSYKKNICNKFVFKFILFAFSPLLGLIFPILFKGESENDAIIIWCKDGHEGDEPCRFFPVIHAPEDVAFAVKYINHVIFYLLLTIVIFVIIYSFIKLLKYEKLKAGKGKMKAKEYYRFCKELF
ncbi:hypothetical protein PVMG_02537 [Plasmodium vivax Mauritania I]|uniref:Variable surface protein Vir35 n=1 Tax=Plasmodium vivax Mauritania I TaxID=1035515 RepID=A0A0J9W335_PLAVI|nr:hypothetical protein PVMG_02537 [Plasmodium vivax Mauritania I]